MPESRLICEGQTIITSVLTSWHFSHLTRLVGSKPHLELLNLLAGGDLLDLEEKPLVVVRGQGLFIQLLGCHFAAAANNQN